MSIISLKEEAVRMALEALWRRIFPSRAKEKEQLERLLLLNENLESLLGQNVHTGQFVRKLIKLMEEHEDQARLIATLQQSLRNEREKRREVEELAFADPLTGLLNSRGIMTALTREIHRLRRAFQKKERKVSPGFTLMLIDLDKFKQVNDFFGHQKGDEVLRVVAQMLKDCFRDVDIIGRSGIGDEFEVILPGTAIDEAHGRAEDFCRRLRAEKDVILGVTASIGLAEVTNVSSDEEIVLTHERARGEADRAMYRVKASGGDNAVVSSKPVVVSAVSRLKSQS